MSAATSREGLRVPYVVIPGPLYCRPLSCGNGVDANCLSSETCYGSAHLCGGQSDCSQCYPWELCGKDTKGNDQCQLR